MYWDNNYRDCFSQKKGLACQISGDSEWLESLHYEPMHTVLAQTAFNCQLSWLLCTYMFTSMPPTAYTWVFLQIFTFYFHGTRLVNHQRLLLWRYSCCICHTCLSTHTIHNCRFNIINRLVEAIKYSIPFSWDSLAVAMFQKRVLSGHELWSLGANWRARSVKERHCDFPSMLTIHWNLGMPNQFLCDNLSPYFFSTRKEKTGFTPVNLWKSNFPIYNSSISQRQSDKLIILTLRNTWKYYCYS